jgi:hypothetical protein
VGTPPPTGGEGDGGSIFGKTREVGLASCNNLSTPQTNLVLNFSVEEKPVL